MNNLEIKTAKRTKNQKLQQAILSSVAIAGLLSVTFLAPNAIQVLKSFGFNSGKRQKERINQARDRLLKTGLLEKSEKGFLSLTSLGETKLRGIEYKELKRPKKWDCKWRVLIFDIPEKRRVTRDKLRRTLVLVGFIKLQDSVWAYPYPCEDFVALLKADFKIGKDILYLIVEEIECGNKLKSHFNLR